MTTLAEAYPASAFDCVAPLLQFVAMGIGVALINSTLAKRFPPWSYLYGRLTYGMMFLSGVFYVVDLLPEHVRSLMLWNPLVHGVE
jgi:capsular polysaccharide transport system permease protein